MGGFGVDFGQIWGVVGASLTHSRMVSRTCEKYKSEGV